MITIQLNLTKEQLENNLGFVQSIAGKANCSFDEHSTVRAIIQDIFSGVKTDEKPVQEKAKTGKSKEQKNEEAS